MTKMPDVFRQALACTLQHEGGYANDPADPGGETNYGISKRSYPRLDIKALTIADASLIYYHDFYLAPGLDRLEFAPLLAAKVFDLGVNCGTGSAGRMLQRAVNTVCAGEVEPRRRAAWRQKVVQLLGGGVLKVDGVIGPITVEVVRACPYHRALLAALKGEAYSHYARLNPLFIPNWLTRLES
ncbi:MAG: hypothetical protein A2Y38_16745 [Spirochaetes bacterium GWB1_59_5]|nr:MAG: hypothetical protein A2Y38_16745 [Spirochaetes bacterium GWB1_59_5]